MIANEFIGHNTTIVTTGFSRVVAAILYVASQTKHFHVYILQGHPDHTGYYTAECYRQETNIPITVISDSAMAYILEEQHISMVLTGADAIVENGGVVNKLGTYTLAMCAYNLGIPFYVAAESYKFTRLYPLHQSDLPHDDHHHATDLYSSNNNNHNINNNVLSSTTTIIDNDVDNNDNDNNDNEYYDPSVDFTPAKYITLLFTDLGVLTTSAVSDELIRLYQ